MTPVDVRDGIVARLKRDLVGPHRADEVLQGVRMRPSDVYLTGILWTASDRMGGEDDDRPEGDDEDSDAPSTPSPVGQQRPCSMGVSICTTSLGGTDHLDVTVRFATYGLERIPAAGGRPEELRWTRRPFVVLHPNLAVPHDGAIPPLPLKTEGLGADVQLHVRARPSPTGRLVTLTLINRSRPPQADRYAAEGLLLFQTAIEVRPSEGTRLVPRPARPCANDEDEAVGRLLYRNVREFAAGHQCSVSWEASSEEASVVRSEWIPVSTVTAFRETGHEVFAEPVAAGTFSADTLSSLPDDRVLSALDAVPTCYRRWVDLQRTRVGGLSPDLRDAAKRNLLECDTVAARMAAGVDALRTDPRLLRAFKLANAAMALQHSWKPSGRSAPLCWRPFQLGFVLLSAVSVCNRDAADREVLDLLWFPTGGGKTEAYLALVAMLAFYRRGLHDDPDNGAGNVALMRYTLRLLTAQQFERAASLVLACELIRRDGLPGIRYGLDAGSVPFSIGLWVGGDATPNRFEEALATRGRRDGPTAEQIDECPCCQQRVRWAYDEGARSVHPYCDSDTCVLGTGFGPWPVFTVDEDVYRERPTLVIGTMDKFALVTTNPSVGDLFGFCTDRSPDLVIQDELHLISGPLGTVAGLYETAFDWLLRKDGRRPKVIGSTATIRRAADQVRALFDRQSCQFPPAGLDHDDSGFAVRDPEKPPRMYAGVTTAGRSAKFTLQAAAGSLLQSAGATVGLSDAQRDGYSTLLAYFNSLRELGGAIVQMLDDVPDSIALYSAQRSEAPRATALPRELTSRVPQKEILEILSELKVPAGHPGAIDVVLATNMVSVGVDVSRLGMMLMNGQPKTRSEYIQATSRVGRSAYPGLVVAVLNAAKPRDRSHFETFPGWHATLYRDVEATSVTPFASRARDRALHAALVAMIRHAHPAMRDRPRLADAPDGLLSAVVAEIERRVSVVDPREQAACSVEIDNRLADWEAGQPAYYVYPRDTRKALLISADLHARRRAMGRPDGEAWPTMNNMRSVEATTRFRMAEVLKGSSEGSSVGQTPGRRPQPRWRTGNG